MKRCPQCGYGKAYRLSNGRRKWRHCGRRYTWTPVWDSVRLPGRVKGRLLEMLPLGVPFWRQRFGAPASAPSMERFYRLCRACCAWEEQLREPFDGSLECDKTRFGGARPGKRGWGAAVKTIVFVVVKRNGCIKAIPIAAHSQAEIIRQIKAHPREGTL